MIRLTHPIYLMLFFCACCIAHGDAASADETEAVAARVQDYVTAFNQRGLDACAEHWSESAEYVLPESGARIQGRKAIREALQNLLGTDEQFKLSVSDQRFRQVSRDVVLEEGNATIVSARHGIERADYVVVLSSEKACGTEIACARRCRAHLKHRAPSFTSWCGCSENA